MAFFNEFPHTRTYDSDLAWLIKRMKETLSRLDEAIAAVNSIPDKILEALNELINNGSIESLIEAAVAGEMYAASFDGNITDSDGAVIAKNIKAQMFLQKKCGTLTIEFTGRYKTTAYGRGSYSSGPAVSALYEWIQNLIGNENYLYFGHNKDVINTNIANFTQICVSPTATAVARVPEQHFSIATDRTIGWKIYGDTSGTIPTGATNDTDAPYMYRVVIPFVIKALPTP